LPRSCSSFQADEAESKAAHHAISTLFAEPVDPKGKPFVVQYEVKLQKGLDCGGAYIKLLTESADGEGLRAGAEYTDKVSFGFSWRKCCHFCLWGMLRRGKMLGRGQVLE
jgi:hypothetical protein